MNSGKKYIGLLLLLLLSSGWFVTIYLIQQNGEYLNQINERDNLIKDTKKRDSIYNLETKRYADTITKYVSETEFQIGGKKVSIEEIIRMFNKLNFENLYLKDSLERFKRMSDFYKLNYQKANDSFTVYKRMAYLAEKNHNLSYKVEPTDKGFVISEGGTLHDSLYIYKSIVELLKNQYNISYNFNKNVGGGYTFSRNPSILDSIQRYRIALELVRKVYNITYKVEEDDNKIQVQIQGNAVDSALVLLKYFRQMLTIDPKTNQWIIDISGKKVRQARRKE